MRVVGVIPSRWGSTRFPGKSLTLIHGKPLIQWVWENARRARRLDDLVVATDDERIYRTVEGLGGRAVMTDSGYPSGTDRVAAAIRDIPAEVVVNIQGDEPLIAPELIDRLSETIVKDPRWDMSTAAVPIRDDRELKNPSVVKVVKDREGRAMYFSRSVIPYHRDGDVDASELIYWRHIGIYAFRRSFVDQLVRLPPCVLERAEKLEQLRALDCGARIAVVEAESAGIGVDTPEDVPYVEAILQRMAQRKDGA